MRITTSNIAVIRNNPEEGEMDNKEPLTISVREAGKVLGLGRDASYEAVRRGDIPALRIGRLWRVPARGIQQMLDDAARPKENDDD